MKLQTGTGSGPGGVSRRAVQPLEVWAGLECTVARIGDQYRDLLAETGHWDRPEDLDAIVALGIRKLRYPVLWEHVAPATPDESSRRAECDATAALLGVESLRMIEDVSAADGLRPPLRERVRHVVTENRRVVMALNADAAAFGALMTQSHASLRDDYAVSVPAMDALVEALQREPGVFGARLTGAGFGGCCVALVAAGKAAETGRRIARRGFERKPQVIVPGSPA